MTLDGLGFSFNGWGEYEYVSVLDPANASLAALPYNETLPFVFRAHVRTAQLTASAGVARSGGATSPP